jgi:diguanylate cyclase (GGDEF)-like protein/PAS domain S-box-containing protein
VKRKKRLLLENPKAVLMLVFTLTFTLLSLIVINITTLELEQEKTKAHATAANYSFHLKSTIERALSSTHTVAALITQGDGVVKNFETIASGILPLYPGVVELAIAPHGIIRDVAPLKGNERAIGLNLFEAENQKKESLLAKQTQQLTLAGPLELVQGGIGLVGRLPIFLDEKNPDSFWGFALAVIQISHLLDKQKIAPIEETFAYEVWRIHPDTKEKQTIIKSSRAVLKDAVAYDFDVPNGTWTMSLEPHLGWGEGGFLLLFREIIALIFSLLLANMARLLIELKAIKHVLEKRVDETTSTSVLLKKQLDVLLDTIPDLIWLKDVNGLYLFCNRAFERFFGEKEVNIVGKSDYDFVDIKTADFFRTHDMIAMDAEGPVVNEEQLLFKEDGYTGYFETIKAPFYNAENEIVGVLGIARDITKRRENEEKIEKLQYFDALTSLPNRMLLRLRIEHDINISKRKKEKVAILFLDIDHFKHINDTLGHAIGDELLIEVSKRLKNLLRQEDTLSRQGGDEFVIVVPNAKTEGVAHVAKKVLQSIEQPIKLHDHELVITASLGIALYPDDGFDIETLFKCADAAMYMAKQNGRNTHCFFTAELQTHSSRLLVLENALRFAHLRGELSLHYQPQISLNDEKVVGVEALLRWNHPTLGSISPAEFIPIAEESGQILLIGEWVLRTAAMRMKQWIDMGIPPLCVAVNLSAVQFHHEHLSALVQTIIDEVKLPAWLLELELTESVAAQNPERAIETMNTLHEQGIRLAIDDFGTGYSSLSYLKRFRVTKLKIDQSFIRDIGIDSDDRAIVATIITLAKSLGLKTIAEGVETKEQLDFLKENGCDEAQGYYFAKPLCVEDFEAFMRL